MHTTHKTHRIASIPGDGIGIEVIEHTIRVLHTIVDLFKTFKLDINTLDWSSKRYLETGKYIPDDGWDTLKESNAILFGAVGSPDVPDEISLWGLILPLRKKVNNTFVAEGQLQGVISKCHKYRDVQD